MSPNSLSSDDLLRALDLAPAMVRRQDGTILYWTHGAETLYGWTRDEALGRSSHELLRTRFPAPLPELVARMHQTGRWEGDLLHRARDGRAIPVHARWILQERHDGGDPRVVEVVTDLSGMLAAREAESRFRMVFDHAAVGMARVGFDSAAWLDVNDAFCRMLDCSRDELLGRPWPAITHPDDIELDLVPFRRMAAGELDRYAVEKRFIRRDGRVIWARLTLSLVRDRSGRPDYEIAVIEDITERRATAEALRASAERYRATFEQAAVGIGHVGTDGRWLRANPALCRIVGYTEAELLERTYGDITHPDDLRIDDALVGQVLAGDIPGYTLEKRYLRRDGSPVWINLTVALVHDAEGAPAYFVSVVEDIDARKRAEAEIRALTATLEERVARRTAELAEANAELEEFNYTVSHDLRAPLRGVQGFADAVLEDYGASLDDTGREYLRRLRQSAEQMDQLIQDLLEYSRLGRAPLALQSVDLAAVARDTCDDLAHEIERRGARLAVASPMPAALANLPTLRRVLENLYVNALKFTAPGVRPEVRVRAEARADEGRVRLWVEDNGIGIAPEHQERIFRPFERLHGVEAYAGTGIGLAIVRRAAERMGGTAGVESRAGEGSRFWIELPAAGA